MHRYHLLPMMERRKRYFLWDEFITAEAAPITSPRLAEPGLGKALTVDAENKISIVDNWVEWLAQATPVYAEEHRVYSEPVITRVPGVMILCRWRCATDNPHYPLALVDSTTPAWNHTNVRHGFFRSAALSLARVDNQALGPVLASFAADGTIYYLLIALRTTGAKYHIKGGAFTSWTYLGQSTVDTTTPLYVASAGYTAVFSTGRYRNPMMVKYLASPLLSDGFGGTVGTSDGLGHAEGVAGGMGSGGCSKVYLPIDPYGDEKAEWGKVQLHCHTTNSDGTGTPAEMLQAYKDLGFKAVVITDHYYLPEYPNPPVSDPGVSGILFIPGEEPGVTAVGDMLAFGVTANCTLTSAQNCINSIIAQGGLAAIPHPLQISYFQNLELMCREYNLGLVEIFNRQFPTDNPLSLWHDYMTDLNRPFYAIAVDDAHSTAASQVGFGWVVVNVDSWTQAEVLEALRRGRFYATQGPEVSQTYDRTAGTVTVTADSSSAITFYGEGGATLQTTASVTSAVYALVGTEKYICAIVVRDSDSKKAWTNPVWLGAWGLSGGKSVNTPSTGSEIAVSYNNLLAADWSLTRLTRADEGAGWTRLTIAAGQTNGNLYNTVALNYLNKEKWYRAEANLDRETCASLYLNVVSGTLDLSSANAGTSPTLVAVTFWPDSTTANLLKVQVADTQNQYGLASYASLKPLNLPELLSLSQFGTPNVSIKADVTTTRCLFAGVAARWDSAVNPKNGVLLVHDGFNKLHLIYLTESLGYWTLAQTWTVSYAAGAPVALRVNGTSYTCLYNDTLQGTATIDVAEINSNVLHGRFVSGLPTESQVDNLVMEAVGAEGQYALLDRFIR